MDNVLLIIGNGFDLRCKLASTFRLFFEYKQKNDLLYIRYFNNEYLFMRDFHTFDPNLLVDFSIWDLFFIKKNIIFGYWNEVEATIDQSLKVNDVWEGVLKDINLKGLHQYHNTILKWTSISDFGLEKTLAVYAAFKIRNSNPTIKNVTRTLFNDFLLEELHVFENSFVKYIKSFINEDYNNAAYNLFLRLLDYDNNGNMINIRNIKNNTILSFNYTDHSKVLIRDKLCNTYINVHGKINNNPTDVIFGIDDIALQNNNDEYIEGAQIFSKSVRKMYMASLSNNNHTTALLNKNHEVFHLIIYGHSLNKADYSYFQSIFDFYDIYNNNFIELVFLFSRHQDYDENVCINSIRSLLVEYGNTMDNPNHGKNLMHKLLLEGRIKRKEI